MVFNASIASILSNIDRVGSEFADVTARLSSGKKTSYFGDDLYVSVIASKQETQLAELAGVNNALTGAIGIVEGAVAPFKEIRDLILQARNELVVSKAEGVGQRADNTARATALIAAIDTVLASVPDDSRKLIDDTSAAFPASGELDIIVGADSATSTLSRISITATSINIADLGLTAAGAPALGVAVTGTGTSETDANINTTIAAFDTALTAISAAEAQLGADLSILKGTKDLKVQEELVVAESFNSLTAADIKADSARLVALELQQQLANFTLRELLTVERTQVAVLLGG